MKKYGKYNLFEIVKKTKEYFFNSSETNIRLSVAVGVGIFTGIIPIWGFQTVLAIILSFIFKLNKIIMLTVSNFSQPPVTPFIILGSFLLGGLFVNTDAGMFHYNSKTVYEFIKNNLLQYVVGSIILAVLLALISGITTYYFLYAFRKEKNCENY